MNTTSYSVARIRRRRQPSHPARHARRLGPDLQAAFDAVPIPANAQAAAGTDEHMVVWQPSTNKMWEFWEMHQEPDGWHARWGGEMNNVSTNPGYFTTGQTNNWGATATGLPLLGGLITQADLQRGYINHALAISLVETAPRHLVMARPTHRRRLLHPRHHPHPRRHPLPPEPQPQHRQPHLPTLDRMIAQAAQTYGIVVRDKSGAVTSTAKTPKT